MTGVDALVADGVLDRSLREMHAVTPSIDRFRPLKAAAGRVELGLDPDNPLL